LLGKLERALESYLSTAPSGIAGAYPTGTAVFQNSATATAFAVSWSCWAAAGEECTATAPPTTTFTPSPTSPSTLTPSATPQPPLLTPTLLAQPGQEAGQGQNLAIFLAAGVISLVMVGYLVLKRSRKSAGKRE
jgi:hypothetical protein